MTQATATETNRLVIGVGNRLRRDDGAGLAAGEMLREMALPGVEVATVEGECIGLLELWRAASSVLVVDAVRGGEPGTIHVFDAAQCGLPGEWFSASSHSFGVTQAVELARALHRLPPRLTIYGIAGKDFGEGEGLSPEVQAAMPQLVQAVRRGIDDS